MDPTTPSDAPGQQPQRQQPWGDVFLQAPSSRSILPSTDRSSALSATYEIIGSTKSVPEDFVVQEIMDWTSVSIVAPPAAAAAAWEDSSQTATQDSVLQQQQQQQQQQPSMVQVASLAEPLTSNDPIVDDDNIDTIVEKPLDAAATEPAMIVTRNPVETTTLDDNTVEEQPLAMLQQVLLDSHHKLQVTPVPHELVPALQGLQAKAIQTLAAFSVPSSSECESGGNTVTTPTVTATTNDEMIQFTVQGESSREERGRLHAWVRAAFGLLHTVTGTTEMTANETAVLQVTMDKRFLGLAQFLHSPAHALPPLYAFYRRDQCPSSSSSIPQQKRRHGKRDRTAAWQVQPHVVLPLKKDLDRSQRRQIHQLLKDASGRQWNTDTISQHIVDPGTTTTAIVVSWSTHASRKRQREATPTKIVVFVVRKTNVEHRMAVEVLARALDCAPGAIQWAGIKDRQAVTYQYCSVNHVPVSRIRTAHTKLSSHDIALGGPIRHVTEPLSKGQAKGNRFTIIVRNLRQIHVQTDANGQTKEELRDCPKESMEAAVKRLRLSGFLNFYGQQRVGTMAAQVRSVDVGRALLQHNFGRVIDLTMRMETDANSVRVRNVWVESEGDVKMTSKALSQGKGGQRHQRTLLQAMKRNGVQDPLRTVQCLSYSERTFWINSYQAYVWNSVAAERIRLYGSEQVVVGDLVAAADSDQPPIRVVSSEMASRYAIHQVVLPLPGFTVAYPSNDVATVYKKILTADKIAFRKDAPLDATAKGSYRPLVVRVPHLEHEWLPADTSPPACRLTFDLPSGAYATSLLRELMYTTVERDVRVTN